MSYKESIIQMLKKSLIGYASFKITYCIKNKSLKYVLCIDMQLFPFNLLKL